MTQIDAPPNPSPDPGSHPSPDPLLTTLSSYHDVEVGIARSLPLDAYTSQDLLHASIAAYDQLATLIANAQATGWRSDMPHALLTGVLWAGVHGIASLQIQGALPAATNANEPAALLDVFQIDLAGLPDTTDRSKS